MGLNDWLRSIMIEEKQKMRGLAEPTTPEKIDRMVALLDECRDMAGSMRMSSKNMALCISIYQALCVAKTYKADGGDI